MTKQQLIGNIISEFAPITSFIIVTDIKGFNEGIGVLIIVTFLSLLFSWFIEHRIPKFGLFAAVIILFFGMLSILLNDPFYIIIKDTLYYAAFGIALVIGLFLKKSPFKMFFGDFFSISEHGWKILSARWAVFFFILAFGNEIARNLLAANTWLVYKFIALCMTWVFGFYQFTLLKRERLPDSNKWGLRTK